MVGKKKKKKKIMKERKKSTTVECTGVVQEHMPCAAFLRVAWPRNVDLQYKGEKSDIR